MWHVSAVVRGIYITNGVSPGQGDGINCPFYSMRQFCALDFPIYMYGGDGKYRLTTMGEVCIPFI